MEFLKNFGKKNKLNELLLKYRKKIVFGGGLLSFLFNESYIIKKGIYDAINSHKTFIKGSEKK